MENEFENLTLAQNIRKIRDIRGFSQEFVAEKLELSQSAYSKIEQGKTSLTEETKEKIAAVLGVSTKVLERYNDNMVFNYCTTQSGHIGNTGETIYNNNPIDKLEAMYAKLLEEKEARIKLLEKILDKGKE